MQQLVPVGLLREVCRDIMVSWGDLTLFGCAGKQYNLTVPAWLHPGNFGQYLGQCKAPSDWDPKIWFSWNQSSYALNDVVQLSCVGNYVPSVAQIRCISNGTQTFWNETATCKGRNKSPSNGGYTEPCAFMVPGHVVKVVGVEDPLCERCAKGASSDGTDAWEVKDTQGTWHSVSESLTCNIETCQRPWWDPGLRLAPDQENYKKDEEVTLSCIDGFQPSFTTVKCAREVQSISLGKPVYRDVWWGRGSRGAWIRIRSSVECVDVLQVVSETLEISSTSIKLNWTCRLPDACQHIRARCRLEEPSSPPCEAEEVKGEEMLHGQEGTFTCPPLQPFTVYSVTISLPPSTILYTRLFRTKEMVPDKPEKLWLDASTGSLRWKALPSCKGEILGYQLNITARRATDGSFLEFKQVMVNQSVTQHTPSRQIPGSKYTVTVQGLTAAGAGAASLLEFQSYIS
ncbi:PREDICTED: uncharacterized protein LOC104506007, partial [Eurypyga helias]|uniref:uncharacterized protein LOC104506007 n=1 Tax=Eurypyga helias TaxID=54383 RepID=UPI0005284805